MAIDDSFMVHKLLGMETVIAAFSQVTGQPLAVCDPETYNDQIWLFEDETLLKEFAKPYTEKKLPIRGVAFKKEQLPQFLTSLHIIGINEVAFSSEAGVSKIPLEDLAAEPEYRKLPEGRRPVENPELQLTGMYFLQEVTRQVPNEEKTDLPQLDEEFSVNLARARYIIPIELKDGPGTMSEKIRNKQYSIPILKNKNGDMLQPLFTDMFEFTRFRKNNQISAIAAPFASLKSMLVKEAKGYMLNPAGFHIIIPPQLIETITKNFPDAVEEGNEKARQLVKEAAPAAAPAVRNTQKHTAPTVNFKSAAKPMNRAQRRKAGSSASKITKMPEKKG